ncbi:MAG: microcystin dependent protein [Betaproteobacteria bacterium]|nr:microcystin dependent protein [Betaproteobacteria bacterium]
MADPFVAEIRIFPFNFPPKGWAFCDGQLMPISQNTALFSLVGTFYGGDGKSTFALPDLQGNAPMHTGQGPGLSEYFLGQTGGSQTVTLLESEMPAHNHGLMAQNAAGNRTSPIGNSFARLTSGNAYIAGSPAPPLTPFSFQTLPPIGGSAPHNNMMPYLTLSFCIALQGVFPPRS